MTRNQSVGCAGLMAMVVALSGCQVFRPNPGRFQAWVAAAHAGEFHRKFHRWPADIGELATFDCPRFDEAMTPDGYLADDGLPPVREDVCAFLVKFPYRIEMTSAERTLAMSFRAVDGRIVCKLRVAAPATAAASTLAPSVRIRTTAFACPGEGEFK